MFGSLFVTLNFTLLNRFEKKIFKIANLLRSDKWARMNADGSVDISQGSGTCPYWSKVSYFLIHILRNFYTDEVKYLGEHLLVHQ